MFTPSSNNFESISLIAPFTNSRYNIDATRWEPISATVFLAASGWICACACAALHRACDGSRPARGSPRSLPRACATALVHIIMYSSHFDHLLLLLLPVYNRRGTECSVARQRALARARCDFFSARQGWWAGGGLMVGWWWAGGGLAHVNFKSSITPWVGVSFH